MAKRRKREPTERTHAQWLEIARFAEAVGNQERADWIRKHAKARFCAEMCYGLNRSFARCLIDEEIIALPAPRSFPWLKD
jgi:hypothetical protein